MYLVRANRNGYEYTGISRTAPYGMVASLRYAGSTAGTAVSPSGTASSIDATAARNVDAIAGFLSLFSSAVSATPARIDSPNTTTSPNRLGARNRLKRGISL